MDIKIEKGIPIPTFGKRWISEREAFSKMKVGESFVLSPNNGQNLIQFIQNIRAGLLSYYRGQYTARREGEGLRIWKIKDGE